MDNLKTVHKQQPQKWKSWFVLLLRWFIGGFAGFISGLFLFVVSETFFPPLLGPIIAGQEELFDALIYLLSNNYSNSTGSLFIYFTIWGLIGALFISGRKMQIKIGVVLLILYIVAGGLFYVIWGFMSLPT